MKRLAQFILIFWMVLATLNLGWAKPPKKRAPSRTSQIALVTPYLESVRKQVRKHWDLRKVPLMERHMRSAVAQLIINKQGRLIKFRISTSSGLKSYDDSLIRAIKRAHPFAPPAVRLRKLLLTRGLEITFRLRVFRKKLLPLQRTWKGKSVIPNWRPKVDGQRKRK